MKFVAFVLFIGCVLALASPSLADDVPAQRPVLERAKTIVSPLNFMPKPSPPSSNVLRLPFVTDSSLAKSYKKLPSFIRGLKVTRNRIVFTFKR